MAAASDAALRTTTAARCSALATVEPRMKLSYLYTK